MANKSFKSYLITCWENFYASDLVLSAVYRWTNRKDQLHILTPEDTIAYILQHNCSIARFGDGEFELMLQQDRDLGFQTHSSELSSKLIDVLGSQNNNLLVCVPTALNSIKGRTKHSRMFWYSWSKQNDQHHRIVELIRYLGTGEYCFGDSQITRSYIAFQDDNRAKRMFQEIRKLWQFKNLLIVEGDQTRLGVGNDLFSNATSIKRVLCPATNAFDRYDEIVKAVTDVWRGELILLALGPTATVLAAEFAGLGMQALDIGHVDIEYEWFLSGAKGHDQIEGKFTNEAHGGNVVAECADAEYQRQIIRRVV